ncbi:MAG: endonuclease [Deltaproteobacteria bacterium RIFCSPLOWO2_12_FULL_40_28]|nr:MAG: endonuclease [Deltaproteobacteria bacterium RIFCSPHIGHO2_02_FULL_40_28]OGQ18980.1 MAG: endonuclease [Deltaproteobacteria bacterium RIFCSPHIGHO2_12_FULL_40_32]OGQ39523.1 MAG: endonuclease [Deltaproteobacteria bacterium RIFCSPLOWO2_02_FULL_40_36]OGQ53413.1 MAG: endonuclease [Deltaproteobacteria bacterium RIFCSPLOWO2_12_FULL_40_28]
MKKPATYIIANKQNGTLYTGVTSNLIQRIYQHKNNMEESFTKKHDCKMLVYFESHNTMQQAIIREKQIKAGSRKKKLALIELLNPDWNDLYEEILNY